MASNPVLRFVANQELKLRVDKYQVSEGLANQSEALRSLVEFALLIKERTKENQDKTTREILEEILANQYQLEKMNKQMYLATYNPDLRVSKETGDVVNKKFASIDEWAKEKAQLFITG